MIIEYSLQDDDSFFRGVFCTNGMIISHVKTWFLDKQRNKEDLFQLVLNENDVIFQTSNYEKFECVYDNLIMIMKGDEGETLYLDCIGSLTKIRD